MEQSLGHIQTMFPVMLAAEVRRVTCPLSFILFLLFFLLFFSFSIPPSKYLMVLSEKFLSIVLFQNIQYSCLHARNNMV